MWRRVELALVGMILFFGCRASEPRWPGQVWTPKTLCVLYDQQLDFQLLEYVDRAAEAWGLTGEGWRVEAWSYDAWFAVHVEAESLTCVPVLVTTAAEVKAWPVARIAQTQYDPDTLEPMSIEFDPEAWATCPESRWALVLHEVGHAAGHIRHRRRGAMQSAVACDRLDEDDVKVSDAAKRLAWRVRRGFRPRKR